MKDETFFDTTILVYAFDISEPTKREICKKLVEKVFKGEINGVVSNQVLGELFVVLTKKIERPISIEQAGVIVKGMIRSKNWRKINYSEKTIEKAINLVKKFKLSFWDALICETMLENNVVKICTENEKDFEKVPKLEIANPLKR